MRILIFGASGFIGRTLVKHLHNQNYIPVAVSRDADNTRKLIGQFAEIVEWDSENPEDLLPFLENIQAVINLAGAGIADKKWSLRRKEILYKSRVEFSRKIVEAIRMAPEKPGIFIQASAVGFYDSAGENILDEDSPRGNGFLAGLTAAWENSVEELDLLDIRLIYLRTGIVLGREGGFLKKIMIPFKFYSGTFFGSGKQWLPWIHLADHIAIIQFLLEDTTAEGPYNLVAPEPVRFEKMIRSISRISGKPAWLRIPSYIIKVFFGEMGKETILGSQRVISSKLDPGKYYFLFDNIEDALKDILVSK